MMTFYLSQSLIGNVIREAINKKKKFNERRSQSLIGNVILSPESHDMSLGFESQSLIGNVIRK